MSEDKEVALKNPSLSSKDFLAGVVGFGIVLASTHGALLPNRQHDLSPLDFKAKVASELHIHNDLHLRNDQIIVDPKYLRKIRSEGDKTAENDGLRGNWDVYQI